MEFLVEFQLKTPYNSKSNGTLKQIFQVKLPVFINLRKDLK
jgi:hypothetical protein